MKKVFIYARLAGCVPRLCLKMEQAFSTTLRILSDPMPSKMGFKLLYIMGVISSSIVKAREILLCLLF
jgi:hypothetical protein